MERSDVLNWMSSHRGDVHGDPAEIVDRTEREVCRHATEDAWLAARRYVEQRMHQWENEWGFHASEAYVAREVCPKLAAGLARHQPHPVQGDEAHLAGERVLRVLEPEARRILSEWVLALADEQEQRTWEQIVRFTRGRGRGLVREGRVSRDGSWEATENFSAKAAHIAEMLAREFEIRSHAGPRRL